MTTAVIKRLMGYQATDGKQFTGENARQECKQYQEGLAAKVNLDAFVEGELGISDFNHGGNFGDNNPMLSPEEISTWLAFNAEAVTVMLKPFLPPRVRAKTVASAASKSLFELASVAGDPAATT